MGKLRVKIVLTRLVVAVPRLRKTDKQEILFYCPDLLRPQARHGQDFVQYK